MANLRFDRIRPSAEKHLSASTLVAGIAKYFLSVPFLPFPFPFVSLRPGPAACVVSVPFLPFPFLSVPFLFLSFLPFPFRSSPFR